jgi:hypothetical protein
MGTDGMIVIDAVVSFQSGAKNAFVSARVDGVFVDVQPDTREAFVGHTRPPFTEPVELTADVWEQLAPKLDEALAFRASAKEDRCDSCGSYSCGGA